MRNIELTLPAVIAADDKDPNKLPTVSINAYTGGPIRVMGYAEPVVLNIAGLEGVGKSIPLLRDHFTADILGQGVATSEDDNKTLSVDGEITNESESVSEVVRLAKRGFPWQASVGVAPTRSRLLRRGQSETVNGNVVAGPIRVVDAGRLYEVSILPIGADGNTSADIAAQLSQGGAMSDQNAALVAMQKQLLDLSTTISAAIGSGDPQPQPQPQPQPAAAPSGPVAPRPVDPNNPAAFLATGAPAQVPAAQSVDFQQLAIDRQREAQAQDVLARAVRAGVLEPDEALQAQQTFVNDRSKTLDWLQLELIKQARADAQGYTDATLLAGGRREDQRRGGLTQKVLECAFAMDNQVEENHYDDETLQAAHDQFANGLSLAQVINIVARSNGYRSHTFDINREVLEYAFPPRIHAARGPSTYDLGGLLSNVANQMVWDAFNFVESSWRQISAIGSVRNFHKHTKYSLLGDFEYKKIPAGGEIEDATYGEKPYENQADTYARGFEMDRRDLINDSNGAFQAVRTKLGRGAAIAMNKVFWTEWLANMAAFWNAQNGNLLEGATYALSIEAATEAERLFNEMKDPDGNPVGSTAQILLTAPMNSVPAQEITGHMGKGVQNPSNRESYTTGNPHVGKWRPVMSRYLATGSGIPNASSDAWWLAADPLDLASVEMVFYLGRQVPVIESAMADFDQLGIRLRGYHDFGTARMEPRGSVMVTGVAAAAQGQGAQAKSKAKAAK